MLHRSDPLLADAAADVTVAGPELLAEGYRNYERYRFTLAVDKSLPAQPRDILRAGRVAAVLALDPQRQELVLIRQFRLTAHLTTGKGEMIEIVAGRVEAGERDVAAAHRECIEEIGVAPRHLIELFTYMPSPGITDEFFTVFLGVVDASEVPEQAGAAAEREQTRPICVSIDAALDALMTGAMRSGPLIIALQWLALNRGRLDDILQVGAAGG